ncbi:hypothetical protein Moror_648 [Moniliophthora roreri MCA 2997]|uniref:Uncharacterized protein n=1 Tax=Moniliophthora roreri (strain MCA 2997) TaxID=1381753 RepID=V2WVY6_MONRO|nr:hypothetical protein Moror_648 [Moniliophthora roreri MCA 2997]
MATAVPSPPIVNPLSPTSPTKASMKDFVFPKSTSPDKISISASPTRPEVVKPNAHPYPIKTTSTALLTRSNSTSSNPSYSGQHRYIPRHRNNSSVSLGATGGNSESEEPRPLPVPPSPEKGMDGEPGNVNPHMGPPPAHQPRRLKLKRSETHSSSSSPAPASMSGNQSPAPPLSLEDLPPNPKQWTPAQLSIYLTTALKVQNERVAGDIAAFIREKKINGRVFLRINEEEMQGYDLNPLWRNALLGASRSLRQNVLKGGIWGLDSESSSDPENPSPSRFETASPSRFTSPSPKLDTVEKGQDDETTPNSRRSVFLNGNKRPVSSSMFMSSPSGRHRNGRVKGMAKGFERIASEDENPAEPTEEGDSAPCDVLNSPTHSKLLSAESQSRIMRDMEKLKKKGQVRKERGRNDSMSSQGSPTRPSRMLSASPTRQSSILLPSPSQIGIDTDLPAPSLLISESPIDSPGFYFSNTIIPTRHDTGSSTSSTGSSRPLPVPPGPPGLSPLLTPPPSALEAEDEMSVEELLALQGGSIRRKAKKEKLRGGVHAWEDGEDGEGFVTVKRVAPSSGSPFNSAYSSSSPAAAEAKRVITPIIPSRRITPISVPVELPQPLRVTSELAEGADRTETTTGGLVHPKPLPVTTAEVGVRMSEAVDRMEQMAKDDDKEKVVRPLPTPPESMAASLVMEPVTPVTTEAVAPAQEQPVIVELEQPAPQQPVAPSQNVDVDDAEELRRLVEDLRRTRALVDALKQRVDEVEKNVEVLREEVEEQEIRRRRAEDDIAHRKQIKPVEDAGEFVEKEVKVTSAADRAKQLVLGFFGISASPSHDRGASASSSSSSSTLVDRDAPATNKATIPQAILRRFTDPKSITELPPYMMLVGLGVCMVVVRVLLRAGMRRR